MTKFVLFLGVVLSAFGQSAPWDAAKLSSRELAPLMNVVCPDHLKNAQTCGVCPAQSEFPNNDQGWQVAAVTFGEFTAPKKKEAVISTIGCHSHASGLGGSFLLRDNGQGYGEVWNRPGYIANACKKRRVIEGTCWSANRATCTRESETSSYIYWI